MELTLLKIAIGFGVGALVGLTGMGGGALLLPLLIFGLHVPPLTAIGSDAAINFISKIGGGIVHSRQRTVNWRLVSYLAAGSIPGSLLGVALIGHLRRIYGAEVNDVLRIVLGLVLLVISVLLFLQRPRSKEPQAGMVPRSGPLLITCFIGLLGGFLVGLTSIGSGTVIMLLLLLFYRLSPATLVGSDIVHAVVLTGVTSVLQYRMGMVDPALVISILIGSVPGVLLGARLTPRVPVLLLKRVLCAALFVFGARMVWI
jgi:uncharacterized protein